MKKLLSILAAVGLTATASTSVVACGKKAGKVDKSDLTSTILKNSSLGSITSEGIMKDLINDSQYSTVFGDYGTATKTFMNYFAEAIMNYISKNTDKTKGFTPKNVISDDAKQYIDDGMFINIKNDWDNRQQNATDAWNKLVHDAPSKYGKKWKDSLFKDMQKQFGKNIYNSSNKLVAAKSYTDYKSLYISYTVLNGSSDGKSLYESLKDDVYLWGKTPNGSSISDLYRTIKTNVFDNSSLKIGDKAINFSSAKTYGDLKAQMKNFIDAVISVKDKTDSDSKTYVSWLLDMYNMTGGLNAEDQLGANQTFDVASIKWATKDSLFKSLNSDTAAETLMKRFDSTCTSATTESTADSKDNLTINPTYDFTNTIASVYTDDQSNQLGAQINGLYSNAQRFVANDYYRNEKPVAVSEIVVSPLYTSTDYSQVLNNSGYVPADATTGVQKMNEFYSFIGNFINNGINSTKYGAAKTTGPLDNSSDYSWDQLMANISGTWPDDVNKDAATTASWNADSDFKGKVKFTSHDNLLTVNSSSSDYSDLLKDSVYDFLGNKRSDEYKFSASAPADTKVPGMVNPDKFKASYPNTDQSSYNTITSFIQSLNRSEKTSNKKMYQVVNAKQGIIAFMDKDGIHFVRVEGYSLLGNGILGAQSQLTASNFSTDSGDSDKANYQASQILNNKLSSSLDTVKNSALTITSDYLDASTSQQKTTGIKYSDLNKTFGNKYLQFLANTSIPKAMNVSNPKYSYDLNALLKTYSGSDITTENLEGKANMTIMMWNYFKTVFGFKDSSSNKDSADAQLFDWVVNGGNGQPNASTKSVKADYNSATIFDPLRNANYSDQTTNDFKNFYKEYITNVILGKYTDYMRSHNALSAFLTDWQNADKATAKIKWTNPSDAGYNPSLQWKDSAESASSVAVLAADENSSSADSKTYYIKQGKVLNDSDIWKPYDGYSNVSPSGNGQDSSGKKSVDEFTYNVEMAKFIPNDFAMKGDEE